MPPDYQGLISLQHLLNTKREASTPVAFSPSTIITWGEFQRDVFYYQRLLTHSPAERIALCFTNSYLFAVGFFAACHAGKSLVLPGNHQPEAIKELGPHFDLLLHDPDIRFTNVIQTLEVTRRKGRPENQDSLLPTVDLEETSLTLFTSGSSGKAKAIQKSLNQLELEIKILESLWGEHLNGTIIQSTVSHQHIYGLLFRLLWPLCGARPFAINNLEYPEQVALYAGPSVTLISSPALLKRLSAEHQGLPLACIFSSGGPLANSAAVHCEALFSQLPIEVFGSTETGGIAYRQQKTATTPWRLFPTVMATLNQENCLRLCAPHINGDKWYQTADECYFHNTVSFELKGRTDRVVKIEEKRVSLVEVEKRLEQLEWVEESVVIPIMDGNRLTLCAVLVLSKTGQNKLNQLGKGKLWLALRQSLRDWLEPIAIPRKYRVLDEVPINSQGKRQVAEIEKLFH